jgi:hypothetical protein
MLINSSHKVAETVKHQGLQEGFFKKTFPMKKPSEEITPYIPRGCNVGPMVSSKHA